MSKINKDSDEEKKQVRLFFATIKMLAFQDYDISPYEELLDNFELQKQIEENGEIPEYTSYEDLVNYVTNVNKYNFRVEKSKHNDEDKMSFLLANYKTGKILYVCFYNKINDDLSTDHASIIIERCMEIWNQAEGNALDGGFTGPNSNYECLIVVKTKIGPYPRERVANIKQVKIINEKIILLEPFDTVFQSEMRVMPRQKYQEYFRNIPKSSIPSIKSTDQFTQYLGIKSEAVEIFRTNINEVDTVEKSIHYKNIIR